MTGLDMQVPEHLIGLPTTQQADAIRIDVGTEKGHGARRPKRAGRNVGRKKSKLGAQHGDREAEDGREVGRCQARQGRGNRIQKGG